MSRWLAKRSQRQVVVVQGQVPFWQTAVGAHLLTGERCTKAVPAPPTPRGEQEGAGQARKRKPAMSPSPGDSWCDSSAGQRNPSTHRPLSATTGASPGRGVGTVLGGADGQGRAGSRPP